MAIPCVQIQAHNLKVIFYAFSHAQHFPIVNMYIASIVPSTTTLVQVTINP